LNAPLRILIIGGYGAFGGRIAELLDADARLSLIVAGRSLDKAQAFCRSRPKAAALLTAATFDRDAEIEPQIARLKPDIVIDASGPFQAYGEGRYRVIEGCIAQRVDYLDLADGSDFVAGVKAFDGAAKAAGISALSGVSSFPVLTAAVVRRLSGDMSRVESIRGGIAPSPFAGVGKNVVRAIAGYSGQSIPLRKNGGMTTGFPLTEQMRFTVAPPGRLPLRNTLFSLVDVPDLRALSDLWPEAQDIWMGAGPVPEILHRLLIGLAWLVRWKLIASLTPIAGLMHLATNRLRWGEHRGGMFVEIVGKDASRTRKRSWHLLAEGDDGPLIPSMAVAAILHRVLAERKPPPGARAATGDLELEDYEALFVSRTIYAGIREDASTAGQSLYRLILGSAYDALPAEIRQMHDDAPFAEGEASVERGSGVLARMAAKLVGFPHAARQTPVRVTFERVEGREIWTRAFGREAFRSRQFAGTGRSDRLLVERFGPLEFGMGLVVEESKLLLKLRRWSAFGIPLPLWLGPRSAAFESVEQGLFHFNVEISHPFAGLIVRYRGWLKPGDTSQTVGFPDNASPARKTTASGD
jgi:hypothetical protein